MHDVIIVGGSYAGLSAALQLGRARRSVLVLDAGQRRNRFATSAHGFLGQDGVPPEAIAAKGRAEVLAYPTVAWHEASVSAARAIPGGFALRTHEGEHEVEHEARRIILATGVVDELPAVPGLAERWGATVFHCPYCHGYELDRGRLAVLATSELSALVAILVSEWSAPGQTTLVLHTAPEPDAEQQAQLAARGIAIERERVEAVEGDAPAVVLRLRDGRTLPLDGLFVHPHTRIATPLPEQLGCALEQGPLGAFIKTDALKQTSVPGVFACGDAATAMTVVALAVADGALAGVAAHRSLVFPAGVPSGAVPGNTQAPGDVRRGA